MTVTDFVGKTDCKCLFYKEEENCKGIKEFWKHEQKRI